MNVALLQNWADIEPLLNALLTLPSEEQVAYLDRLPPAQQVWRATLEQLMRADSAANAAGFLDWAASLPLSDSTPARKGGDWRAEQVLGPWQLVRELGRGGMASVWLARPADGEFQREVALKLPHSPTPQLAERFRRERDVLARLNHPGIARLFDAGVTPDGLSWLAMEWVDGQDLISWSQAEHRTVKQDLALLLQICDALQYAHGQLVIHRDIKPANVLVQADGQTKLLDFGIARLLEDPAEPQQTALTQLGQRPMTPEYASPEQVRGEVPGVASDVYTLGVLAYRLLSGQSPYAGATAQHRHALEQAILEFRPPSPSQQAQDPARRKALRGDLDTIVLKALSKDAEDRYATVEALAADLRRHLDGEPVLARAPSWRYVADRFVRRHRIGVSATALAAMILLGSTGWALMSSHQARSEARRAEAMYDFVLGLFNPDHDTVANVKLPDLPLKEVIERGARRALTELKDQPEVRAKLLHDLAPMVEQLGLVDLATTLAQTRVEDTLRAYGSDSLPYADALLGRSHIREATGEFKEGLKEAKQAQAIYEAHHVQDPYRLVPLYEKLGGFGFRSHPNAEPEDAFYLDRAVALAASLKDVNASQSSILLGILRLYLGEIPKAYTAVKQGLEANQRDYGADSWQASTLEAFLGVLAEHGQRPAEAEALLRQSVTTMHKAMGADYIGLARNKIGLAGALFAGQQREEARQLMADALRIVELPINAGYGGVRDQVQVLALGMAWRGGDWNSVKPVCQSYQKQSFKATTPYYTTHLAQVCAANSLREGDLALAGQWLDAAKPSYTYFTKAPSWTMGLDLRRGELAWAQGDKDEALRLWRHALSVSNTTQLAWQSQAWRLIAQNVHMDAAELGRLQAFKRQLEQAGGERYYAEFLKLLREAIKSQMS
ncbi:serine/threonine-protein kinase [Roseateles koreensis]|uniref:Serine/threonine-protein kinase n=1 Tax=Roseateles koreensis TaxID=2987526 RepID=A0ABT5KTB9_9BURK|nr:serine/threonine-protein kinase [Roseateles koreensis]MDC8785588.1 serine/threonine-protein kinase [Roseateles koreensis]